MGLKKGCTPNNPKGRPQGATNKENRQLRALINQFLTDNWDNIKQDFEALQPQQRIKLYTDLLAYALPRLEAVPVNESELKIDYLSPEALDQLTQHIKNHSNAN